MKDIKSKKKNGNNLIGKWSFFIAIILAILLGLGFTGNYQTQILWALFLLGIIIGILNIQIKEISKFLRSATILVLISFLGIEVGIFNIVAPAIINILKGILTLFVPATIVVALRSTFYYAKK